MDNTFTIYSFLLLLACLLCGMVLSWLLYRSSVLALKLRVTLAIFRAIAFALVLWLTCSPLIRQITYTLEKPVIVLAQDNSQSVGAIKPQDYDPEQYRKNLLRLQEELSHKYEVMSYSFSDKVRSGLDFSYGGKYTDAAALTSQLNDELSNRNVGAVIIASDGIFNRGGNPVAEISKLKAPVYTIALGDTAAHKDVLIENVNHNDIVYLDNNFRIEVQLRAEQCMGGQSVLSVIEDGHTLHEQVISFKQKLVATTIPILLKAAKTGMHRYTLSLSPQKGELSLQNNTQQIAVEVIDDRKKILIASAGPHPDIAALREAITLDKHHEVSLLSNEKLSGIDPDSYGLIILYQLPALADATSTFLTKVQRSKVPLWYIVGAQTSSGLFNQIQQGLSLPAATATMQYNSSVLNSAFSLFDTDQQSRQRIENFDPLQVNTGPLRLAGDHQDVLFQRSGKLSTAVPQLFFMNTAGRKTAYLIGEGLWRWKLSEARETGKTMVFDALVGKVVQYLAVQNDKRKFMIRPAKQSFDENEPILINATLYNDSYIAVNAADVQLQLSDEKNKTYNFSFSKAGTGYQLDAGMLPPGKYKYVGNTVLGNHKYSVQGSFFINSIIAEFQQTVADHRLLYQLSAQTNGRMFSPAELSTISKVLNENKNLKTLSYEDRKYEELINYKWLFVLIMALLSTEWFLRKRNAAL